MHCTCLLVRNVLRICTREVFFDNSRSTWTSLALMVHHEHVGPRLGHEHVGPLFGLAHLEPQILDAALAFLVINITSSQVTLREGNIAH